MNELNKQLEALSDEAIKYLLQYVKGLVAGLEIGKQNK